MSSTLPWSAAHRAAGGLLFGYLRPSIFISVNADIGAARNSVHTSSEAKRDRSACVGPYCLAVPEVNRRNLILIGMAALAATVPAPTLMANASPADWVPAPAAPPLDADTGGYLFQDEFDGPLGSAPDPGNWTVQNWADDVWPRVAGQYRDDRRNVFLDGNSNLVVLATKEDDQFFSGKVRGNWRVPIGHTWEARVKLDCLTSGAWPAYWAVKRRSAARRRGRHLRVLRQPQGWPPGTTVHAASNGKTWEGKSIAGLIDGAWHTWRMRGTRRFQILAGLRRRCASRISGVPPKPIPGARQSHRFAVAVQQSRLLAVSHVHPCGRWARRR